MMNIPMSRTLLAKAVVMSFLAMCLGVAGYGQETLVNCGNNVLRHYCTTHPAALRPKNAVLDTLELPFFDDFAQSNIYPDTTKWADNQAFINNEYAVNPLTVNVATLDAIDAHGSVYRHLPSHSSDIADHLTSKPINLAVRPADSVYLSFYYQAGGTGNRPEGRDSLVVQFKAPNTEWQSVWHTGSNVPTDTFMLAHIPITDSVLLQKGFRFRFLNYASISSNYEPSWISNSDIWNIDFVKLDTARSVGDTLPNDVAMFNGLTSFVPGYEAVPWKHFNAKKPVPNDSLVISYRNLWGGDDVISVERAAVDRKSVV